MGNLFRVATPDDPTFHDVQGVPTDFPPAAYAAAYTDGDEARGRAPQTLHAEVADFLVDIGVLWPGSLVRLTVRERLTPRLPS